MEKKTNILNTRNTLPPNVNGRCRGTLSLCLHEIKWLNDEPFQFNWIQAKFIWWGDKYHSGATLKLKNEKQLKKSFGNVIQYNILTKLTLFRNYLRSSESIEVKFSSGISNIEIGHTNIPIPVELIKFLDQNTSHSVEKVKKIRRRCHIYNAQQKIMGEILMEYGLTLYDRVLSEGEIDNKIDDKIFSINEKQCVEIENNMNHFNLDLDPSSQSMKKSMHKTKFKVKSPHKKMNAENVLDKMASSKTKRLSSKSRRISSPLMNYLTGRPLAEVEENEARQAMASTSPTESLIDLLSNDLNGLYIPRNMNDIELKLLKKIDCLRIQVYDLCLTRAGTREILSKNALNETSFSSGTFTVDVDLDSILSTKSSFEKNNMFMSKVTRIFSSSIESLPPCIAFNRSSVHKLNTFCIKSRSSYANGIISLIIRYRDIESSESRTLGTARIQLADVMQATNLTFHQQCPVTTTTSEIIIGRLSVNVELGCRGLHFGADFIEAISSNAIDANIHSVSNECGSNFACSVREYPVMEYFDSHVKSHEWSDQRMITNKNEFDDFMYKTCVYDVHDDQTDDKSNSQSTPLKIESNGAQQTNRKNTENITDDVSSKDLTHGLNKMEEMNDDIENELKGLFHIGQINNCSVSQLTNESFVVCRPFWSESSVLVTEYYQNKTNEENYPLNYFELFSVICDQNLFESTKHGFMSIEVWHRDDNHTKTLIGSAKVPLHQFFIAFNNNIMRNHVTQQELPVISIDGWVTISSTNSPIDTPVGTVQAILAVGTIKQINHLKRSKNLESCKTFLRLPREQYPLVNVPQSVCERNQESNIKTSIPQFNDRSSNFAAMFSNFIDTLASRLPDRNATETASATNDATTQTHNGTNNNIAENSTGKYMRPTSELLDELQRALSIAPTPAQMNVIPTMPANEQKTIEQTQQNVQPESKRETMFRIHFEIESALHLPSIAINVNKKSGKRNRNSMNSTKKNFTSIDIQPCSYVTFEASASATQTTLTSYATGIVEHSCSPQWNKHFEVFLPIDFLLNDEKRFVIRVWRKISDNTPKTRLIPNSSNDVTIGFASVDLSVLMAGLPTISGWFNIIDHAGCINGQIKIHIKPKDDLSIHQKRPSHSDINPPAVNESMCEPKKIDQTPVNVTSNENQGAVEDSALSRALKRKFTELEEITQRLKARLFDVTGNMPIETDDQFDGDLQFESDLNTVPNEDDDDFEVSNIASEMSLDWLEHCQNHASSNASSSNFQDQMQHIFDEFLSPSRSEDNQSGSVTHQNQIGSLSNIDFLDKQLNDCFNAVLNDEQMNKVENDNDSVQNIAETLKKSAIND
ncbi:uncharacterized protein LOC116346267 [Contarinia nasturtii]|uniref:uncharacterized protein LOC116346267 n=1 Tax=Contarinia nasturtii TaxID=265458 RepID=UPI0012D45641|nr:uncharacterized protein LOC116346267 [Contarinia nasturtii]